MQINFEQTHLDNGLKVIVYTDPNTPLIAVNLIYDVGSKDENPELTGLAHLFEHLMFGGSKNAPDFDEILEYVGGENNAFTNNDFTDYYICLPKSNWETALWLERDRMKHLSLSKKSISVQKNVVIEEFKQRYLNQPYGDVGLLLKPLVYTQHPYGWSTIGKSIDHVEKTEKSDVEDFYHRYYAPDNAILTIGGNITMEEALPVIKKYFENIPKGNRMARQIPQEPLQTMARHLEVVRDVPHDALFLTFHMCERMHSDFYAFDLLSDIFSNGKSSRFYLELVKNRNLFTEVNAYISGDMEAGAFMINGHLKEGVSMKEAENGIWEMIEEIKQKPIDAHELEKVKNKVESSLIFSNSKALDIIMNLGYFELLGGANLLNLEDQKYRNVSTDQIQNIAREYLRPEICSSLYYYAKNSQKA